MLIGLISDTHDRTDPTAKAVQLLQSKSAQFFLHCGDVGSPAILDHLAGLPAAFVWGNCDFDRLGLQRYAQSLGIQCLGHFGELELAGKRLALTHGDDPTLKRKILSEQRHDYFFQGHTHIAQDLHIGKIHLINPGALHRANPRTCALLDTDTDTVEFLKIE